MNNNTNEGALKLIIALANAGINLTCEDGTISLQQRVEKALEIYREQLDVKRLIKLIDKQIQFCTEHMCSKETLDMKDIKNLVEFLIIK